MTMTEMSYIEALPYKPMIWANLKEALFLITAMSDTSL